MPVHQVISLQQRGQWEEACARVPTCDVYYRHAYAQLCHDAGEGDPFLFTYEDGAGRLLLCAFLRRPLAALPFATQAGPAAAGGWDIVTPARGYGGPLGAAPDAGLLRGFRAELDAYCREMGIVTEFMRVHPVLGSPRLLAEVMDVAYDRETVLVDLRDGAAALQGRLHPGHRRNLRRAEAARLHFQMLVGARAVPQLAAFHRLYLQTMDKVRAAAAAYLPLRHFTQLFSLFGQNALLGAVLDGGRLVSGAVYLREGALLHYYLGGSDRQLLHLGSNVFQFYQAARWGAEHGCLGLHLGGGHVGRDALFTFKRRFDSGGLRSYCVARRVHLPQAYARLVAAWVRHHRQPPGMHYFPAYRAAPAAASAAAPAPAAGAAPAKGLSG